MNADQNLVAPFSFINSDMNLSDQMLLSSQFDHMDPSENLPTHELPEGPDTADLPSVEPFPSNLDGKGKAERAKCVAHGKWKARCKQCLQETLCQHNILEINCSECGNDVLHN